MWINPQNKKYQWRKGIFSKKWEQVGTLFYVRIDLLPNPWDNFYQLSANNVQPFQVVSALSIIIFLILFIFAGYSFIYPWLYNKKNREYRFEYFDKYNEIP